MENKNIIIPKKLQGFWELMPREQMLFSQFLAKIEEVFKQNCFVPLDTPVLEYSETLLAKSGGDSDKEVYRFSKGSTDMCMRYDLTVPLARFVSMYQNELNFPFKRYQIGKVYRGEKPQKGRFREFYQCDADIIGSENLSLTYDAECLSTFEQCFKALNLEVEIHVSNRKILAGLIEDFNQMDNLVEIFIALDKINKVSLEELLSWLQEIGLTKAQSETLIEISKLRGNFDEINQKMQKMSKNATFLQGLAELEEVNRYVNLLGCKSIVFDLSIIRGHNYYTGTVFEAFLKGKENLGAVGAGGRFENLCSYFSERKMPGVGMSVGVTRLFNLLMNENYFDISSTSEIDCAIINFDETFNAGLSLMAQLRSLGIRAEMFCECKSFKSKMKEANRRNVPYVIILGEDEVNSKMYSLKNMQTSEQEKLPLNEVVKKIKSSKNA